MPRGDITKPNFIEDPIVSNEERTVYLDVMDLLTEGHISFLVGGGIALAYYTGVRRATKDLDLMVLPRDVSIALEISATAGYQTQLRFDHWLGKISKDDVGVDVVFSSGNGLCAVDEECFEYGVSGKIFNRPVRFCPPEEIIWSKAFVMERNRF